MRVGLGLEATSRHPGAYPGRARARDRNRGPREAMSTRTHAQDACLRRVASCLNKGLYPNGAAAVAEDEPVVVVSWGKETFAAVVVALGSERTAIHFFARVASEITCTPRLMEHLLRANADRRFGAFGIDKEGIVYQYALMGTASDDQITRAALWMVDAMREEAKTILSNGARPGIGFLRTCSAHTGSRADDRTAAQSPSHAPAGSKTGSSTTALRRRGSGGTPGCSACRRSHGSSWSTSPDRRPRLTAGAPYVSRLRAARRRPKSNRASSASRLSRFSSRSSETPAPLPPSKSRPRTPATSPASSPRPSPPSTSRRSISTTLLVKLTTAGTQPFPARTLSPAPLPPAGASRARPPPPATHAALQPASCTHRLSCRDPIRPTAFDRVDPMRRQDPATPWSTYVPNRGTFRGPRKHPLPNFLRGAPACPFRSARPSERASSACPCRSVAARRANRRGPRT